MSFPLPVIVHHLCYVSSLSWETAIKIIANLIGEVQIQQDHDKYKQDLSNLTGKG
jgi:predicted transcriptional regulator